MKSLRSTPTISQLNQEIQAIKREVDLVAHQISEGREENKREFTDLRSQIKEHYPIPYRIEALIKEVVELKSSQKLYVTRGEFLPVKNIVYGAIVLILVAVFGALIATVVNK